MWLPIGPMAVAAGDVVVPRQSLTDAQLSLVEYLALADRRTPNDELDRADVGRRP